MTNFRDEAWNLSPSRLRTYWASQLVYAFIGYPLDLLNQAAKEATRVRFPAYCPSDALPYHGRDRGVRRGPNEPDASFIARLVQWRSVWNGSGVGRSMLDEVAAFLLPALARVRVWTETGVIYTREADGAFRVERTAAGRWNWDGKYPTVWSRFWLIIYATGSAPAFFRDGLWGDGTENWGDNASTASWGSTATLEQVHSIRAIIDDRKPVQSVCQNIIVSFADAAFAPTDASPPLPDGLWANASKNVGGTQVSARDERAIYWDGVQ